MTTNEESKHSCVFSQTDREVLQTFVHLMRNGGIKTLVQFVGLLQNGGLEAFRHVLDLGDCWMKAKAAAANVVVTAMFGAVITLLLLGLYVWTH